MSKELMNEDMEISSEDFDLAGALEEMGYIKAEDSTYEKNRQVRELTPAEEFIKKDMQSDLINKHLEAGYAIGAMFKILIQSGMKYDDAVAITATYNQLVVGDNIVAKSSSI